MKRIIVIGILLFGIAFLFGACASSGKKFDMDKVAEVKPGVTTQEDCRKMFGKPVSVSRSSIGGETWTYSHASVNSIANTIVSVIPIPGTSFLAPKTKFKSSTLIIMFDKDGIVKDFHTRSSKK